MSVFKKIDSNDVSITSFNVHKNYTIDSTNYSGSGCGYGVQILSATHHSWSFGDSVRGRALDLEETNPNGTYKSIIFDSIKHLYYSRVDKPAENFGGNIPEKEDRFLQKQAHVISIPSPLYDLRIKSGSVNLTDHYIDSLAIDRQRVVPSPSEATYTTPPILTGHFKFETSASRFTDSSRFNANINLARAGSISGIAIASSSIASGKVGTGSIHFKVSSTTVIDNIPYNVGNGILLRDGESFAGISNTNWWSDEELDNEKHGMPSYTVTMWVNPMDWNKGAGNVTGAPGQSTIITRDKNSYFELNILTSSMSESAFNPKGIVPLQMFWGATGSNCTTSASRDAVSEGFALATGSYNFISVTQEFWPGDVATGTSGSYYEQLPPWGRAAKTTLRIYRPDPTEATGYKYIKRVGYATASLDIDNNESQFNDWSNLTSRFVTSSIQYNRHMYIGASGSVGVGAADNNSNANTLKNAFTGSMDDIRFYESTLDETQIANLIIHPEMALERTPPVTASFNLVDDGYGNLIDKAIHTSSFASPKKLLAYYGFNELYTIEGQMSKSIDFGQHKGMGAIHVQDFSEYKNTAIADKVKFIPGIAVRAQSGSLRNADAINFYQTDVPTGIRAQFNNSGSIRIPHTSKLNLGSEDGFAISFWIKIPENQIPGVNTITDVQAYNTTGEYGGSGGTSEICYNQISGSTAGRDYITLIGKLGLGKKELKNAATGEKFMQEVQDRSMEINYPYHIQLKNTSYEKDGALFDATGGCLDGSLLNTIVLQRSDGDRTTFLESKTALHPHIDNHVVIQKKGTDVSIWINGILDNEISDTLKCTDNISDIFLGDNGAAWATGSRYHPATTSNIIPPQNPFSGSLDEIRFYDTSLSETEIFSLYDNNFNTPSAYQTNNVGNVFYEHGILALTNTHYPMYFSGSLHAGTAVVGNNSNAIFSNNFKLKFQNTRELFEQQIRCHSKSSDFNLTTNPTARKTSLGPCKDILSVQELADFATDPTFNPYVTTIGLYDDSGRLLAVAKLARPIQKLKNVDMTFVVKFDR